MNLLSSDCTVSDVVALTVCPLTMIVLATVMLSVRPLGIGCAARIGGAGCRDDVAETVTLPLRVVPPPKLVLMKQSAGKRRRNDRGGGSRRAVQQCFRSELRLRGDAVNAGNSGRDLRLVGLHRHAVVDSGVAGVNGELADVAQQAVDFRSVRRPPS